MNPFLKLLIISNLLVSCLTLVAQFVGGDVIALLVCFAASTAVPFILPKLLGFQMYAVDQSVEPARRESASAELSIKHAKAGTRYTKAEVLEAMDADIAHSVEQMDKETDMRKKFAISQGIRQMRDAREHLAKLDEKDF